MERSSQVPTTAWKHKNLNFLQESSKLNFDLCRRAEIIQVGLNMNLYDDIGDVSRSLRGSTSSYIPNCLSQLECMMRAKQGLGLRSYGVLKS